MHHQSRLMLLATILALSLWLFGCNGQTTPPTPLPSSEAAVASSPSPSPTPTPSPVPTLTPTNEPTQSATVVLTDEAEIALIVNGVPVEVVEVRGRLVVIAQL
jgi:hypothetical protein